MNNESVTRRGLLGSSLKSAAEWVGPNLPTLGNAAPSKRVPLLFALGAASEEMTEALELACLYGLPEADIRGIILEPTLRAGSRAIHQLNYLTGRTVPALVGLPTKLRTPEDRALDQPAECQQGVNFLLSELEASREKLVLVAMGTGRDIAAAYLRSPKLFHLKCRALYLFVTEPAPDPHALTQLMHSGLPLNLVPPGELVKARLSDVLQSVADPLLRYVHYHLRKEQGDPIAYLLSPVSTDERSWLLHQERTVRGASLLGLTVGRRIVMDGHDLLAFDGPPAHTDERALPHRLAVRDRLRAQPALLAATADLLTRFPLRDSITRA